MPSTNRASTSFGRWWRWLAQLSLAGLVGWFVWRTVSGNLDDLRNIDQTLEFHAGMVLAAAGIVIVTYALLIAAWRAILLGWNQQLAFLTAARIWCLSNLGRYVPGKVWSVAGLAVLAQKEGVHGWAAAGSALVMQVLAVGTGVAVAFAFLPDGASPLPMAVGLFLAAGCVFVFTNQPVMDKIASLAPGKPQLSALTPRFVLFGATAALASWLSYGFAFYILALGVIPNHVPPLGLAIGAFSTSYIVGLFALFAPGGLIVRETFLLTLLAPTIGAGPALALSVASRLLVTFTEVSVALAALLIPSYRGERG